MNIESRQRSWWPTHTFITELVAQANVGPLPAAGTPAWMALADGDPRKLLSLAVDGVHHVLRCETAQEQLAAASAEISSAEDWSAVSRQIRRGRGDAYIPRKREVAS